MRVHKHGRNAFARKFHAISRGGHRLGVAAGVRPRTWQSCVHLEQSGVDFSLMLSPWDRRWCASTKIAELRATGVAFPGPEGGSVRQGFRFLDRRGRGTQFRPAGSLERGRVFWAGWPSRSTGVAFSGPEGCSVRQGRVFQTAGAQVHSLGRPVRSTGVAFFRAGGPFRSTGSRFPDLKAVPFDRGRVFWAGGPFRSTGVAFFRAGAEVHSLALSSQGLNRFGFRVNLYTV